MTYLSIPLEKWAKALGFSDPDEVEVPWEEHPPFHQELVDSTDDWYWDEDEDDEDSPVNPEIWQSFCQKFQIDWEETPEEFLDSLRSDWEGIYQDALYRDWLGEVESATGEVLSRVDIHSFPPVNITGDFNYPPMPTPDNFPQLEWAIEAGSLDFKGSSAPLSYLLMILENGMYGTRWSGINEFGEPSEGEVLAIPDLMAEVFGHKIDASWGEGVSPYWSIRDAIARIKADRR